MKTRTQEEPIITSSFPTTLPAKISRPEDFKAVKRLTRDLNTLTRLGQILVCIQSELYTIDMPDPARLGETRPVGAIDILDCLAGQELTLICGVVLHSTLKREKEPLTGRYFALRQTEMAPGKRYYKPEVVEVERTA